MLELRNLVKHYPSPGGETVRAVDDVSLTVTGGELVAIYGPSGSGKTTLLLLAAALLSPDSGAVIVSGRDISRLTRAEAADYRRTGMGFVRQTLDLQLGLSVLDNAALKLFGRRRVRDVHQHVEPLLVRVGLEDRLRHRAEQLSMGERQRVLIARALSTEPPLLLADEPTGSLDRRRSREILGLLTEVCREREVAMLLVTHDPQAVGYADRVFSLVDGQLCDYEPDDGPVVVRPRL